MKSYIRMFVLAVAVSMMGFNAFAADEVVDTPQAVDATPTTEHSAPAVVGADSVTTTATEQAAPVAAQPEMTAEQKAAMEKMKQAMTPNDNHKIFEGLVGKWTYTSKCWMDAKGAPEVSTGVAENSLIYGGRFLKSDVKGTWQGQAFEGTGILGFDIVKDVYESTWYDNMMTGIMYSEGTYDNSSKTLNLKGTCACPLTGEKNRPMRTEWKVVDADHNTYSSYTNDKDGNEYKAMEIEYTRA